MNVPDGIHTWPARAYTTDLLFTRASTVPRTRDRSQHRAPLGTLTPCEYAGHWEVQPSLPIFKKSDSFILPVLCGTFWAGEWEMARWPGGQNRALNTRGRVSSDSQKVRLQRGTCAPLPVSTAGASAPAG